MRLFVCMRTILIITVSKLWNVWRKSQLRAGGQKVRLDQHALFCSKAKSASCDVRCLEYKLYQARPSHSLDKLYNYTAQSGCTILDQCHVVRTWCCAQLTQMFLQTTFKLSYLEHGPTDQFCANINVYVGYMDSFSWVILSVLGLGVATVSSLIGVSSLHYTQCLRKAFNENLPFVWL